MVRWSEFALAAPAIASRGEWLLTQNGGVAFLATVRRDATPQLHPVMPLVFEGVLYVFVVEVSSKFRDLTDRGSYALHTIPTGAQNEEFMVRGRAERVGDPALRTRVAAATGFPKMDWEILFALEVTHALHTSWAGWGSAHPEPTFLRWKAGGAVETIGPAPGAYET